jgi:hypothetical protein
MTRYLNIPCSVTIEVDDDFDLYNVTDDDLMEIVVDQHGKYPTVDARYLGYEVVEEA